MKERKNFKLDGTRPVESSEREVIDTFEEDGTRPIMESPDFLVRKDNNSDLENHSVENDDSEKNKAIAADNKRPVDSSDLDVVDTFEEDGTRPIMSNEYRVVDTLNVDGERPITSESNIS